MFNHTIQPIDLYDTLILDTETTGLDENAEILEISVIHASTEVAVFNTLIKPSSPIPAEATAIHGISNEMVKNAPNWDDVFELFMEVMHTLSGDLKSGLKNLIIYNASFDIRIINQTSAKYGIEQELYTHNPICAMHWYAEYFNDWCEHLNRFKWQRLTNAAQQQNVDFSDLEPHRAYSDCVITSRLIKAVNKKLSVQL